MILVWQISSKSYTLEWQGPGFIETAIGPNENDEKRIAVVFGPQGLKGDKGDPGVGQVPNILDGGNF